MSKSQKGGQFEREICVQLSLWWSDGELDDVFWRSSTSGARATVRHRKGKTTFGQYGDIQAVRPEGMDLTNFCTIECKRGYSDSTFADLIETPDKQNKWLEFFEQARIERRTAKVPYYLLIVKRDRKPAVIFMEAELFNKLIPTNVPNLKKTLRYVRINIPIYPLYVVGLPLSEFFSNIKPSTIKQLCHQNR